MPRYMTAYIGYGQNDYVAAFTEDENWQAAQEDCEDFVWQFAPDREAAIRQHFTKLDEWEANPTRNTY